MRYPNPTVLYRTNANKQTDWERNKKTSTERDIKINLNKKKLKELFCRFFLNFIYDNLFTFATDLPEIYLIYRYTQKNW